MKALILVNGELYKPDILRDRILAETFALIISADGGTRHAHTLNITPDAIIGDMDSISDSEKQFFNKADFICYPAEKDETDLELAILYAEKQGVDQIVLVGAMGGRMDMTIASILLATCLSPGSCRIEVWHGEQTGWVIRPPGEDVSGHPGDMISLIPLTGAAAGITTKGLKYPLNDEDLTLSPVRGISNLMEQPSVDIRLSDGLLLAIHTPGRL